MTSGEDELQTGTPQKAIKRTKMGLSGTLGKRFVFQIESQKDNPLRKRVC